MIKDIISKYKILLAIFCLALVLRFLFYPGNIYFGFDQARDAFISLEIIQGDIQLRGPSTSFEGLFHGALYYYIIAPIYLIFHGNPTYLAAFLRIINALGVVLIYLLTSKILFPGLKKIGIISSLLFAVSFEQIQFSLYMGNPSLASLSVILIYLGLALIIFKKNYWGLSLTSFFLGVSIQFEFLLFYIVIPVLIIVFVYFKEFKKINLKIWIFSVSAFVLSISSFIIAEVKYNFPTINVFLQILSGSGGKNWIAVIIHYYTTLVKIVRYNLFNHALISNILVIALIIMGVIFLKKYKQFKNQIIFLIIWFFGLFFLYIFAGGRTTGNSFYFYDVGISPSLVIFISLVIAVLIDSKFTKNSKNLKALGLLILTFILISNLYLTFTKNSKGTIPEITPQLGMLLGDELKVLDLIYGDAKGEMFAAKGLTVPYQINTTWSYLYSWYGKNKYGYTPIWGDKNATGYPGNLKVIDAQDALPERRYLIVEPLGATLSHIIGEYLRIEGYFTNIEWEEQIGDFKVQKRVKY